MKKELNEIEERYFKFEDIDIHHIDGPIHITDEVLLQKNLSLLKEVQENTGANILIALKAFAQFSLFEIISKYLQGATASSLFEAKLAQEEFKKKYNPNFGIHAYAPAYPPADMPQLLEILDHIVFNSFAQYEKFKPLLEKNGTKISVGMRINPEHSEVKKEIYNPCSRTSRLGVRLNEFEKIKKHSLDGLHFHTLCELNSDALLRTWKIFDEKFGKYLNEVKWMNLGGGHLITSPDYDIPLLYNIISEIKSKYPHLTIYLEPGEAIVLNCGVLVSEVLDIVQSENAPPVAILDISGTAHLPDVIEMPYRPNIFTNKNYAEGPEKTEKCKYLYKLGGVTCLAGDVIGDFSFKDPLEIGQKIYFTDMSHYTMVKSTNFNGIRTPSIAISNIEKKSISLVKRFEYQDYKSRLS